MISDVTLRTLQSSLRGLDARRTAAENNIANVETPGFTASTVSFEDSLRDAIDRGRPSSLSIDSDASPSPSLPSGNNVDVADEQVSLTETALRQQLVVRAMNGKYDVMRTAING